MAVVIKKTWFGDISSISNAVYKAVIKMYEAGYTSKEMDVILHQAIQEGKAKFVDKVMRR